MVELKVLAYLAWSATSLDTINSYWSLYVLTPSLISRSWSWSSCFVTSFIHSPTLLTVVVIWVLGNLNLSSWPKSPCGTATHWYFVPAWSNSNSTLTISIGIFLSKFFSSAVICFPFSSVPLNCIVSSNGASIKSLYPFTNVAAFTFSTNDTPNGSTTVKFNLFKFASPLSAFGPTVLNRLRSSKNRSNPSFKILTELVGSYVSLVVLFPTPKFFPSADP